MQNTQADLRPAKAGPARTAAAVDARPVTLALQGGGSLGAFSWGVLDRRLDEPAIRVGAASGAMSAAMAHASPTKIIFSQSGA